MTDQTLPLKTYDQLVAEQVTAVQDSSDALVDFTIGSIGRAFVESNTLAVALWLQAMAEYDLAIARLTTSKGLNVDSFLAQFGLTRLPGNPASGLETFSRFTPTTQAIINLTAQVSSIVSGQVYTVIKDTNNANWNPTLNAYTINIGVSSANIPVKADNSGAQGNAIANSITTINTVINGVDTVTNSDAFLNGQDSQSDEQAKAYFILFFKALSKATKSALAFALLSIPDVERQNLIENLDFPSNEVHKGFFYGIVDDGSGDPPQSLLDQAALALDATRAFGIQFSVYAPAILTIDIVVTVTIVTTASESTVTTNVNNCLSQYLYNRNFQGFIPFSFVPNLIYDSLPVDNQASPNTTFGRDTNILNVTGLTVNGGTVDIQAESNQLMKLGTLTINYT